MGVSVDVGSDSADGDPPVPQTPSKDCATPSYGEPN